MGGVIVTAELSPFDLLRMLAAKSDLSEISYANSLDALYSICPSEDKPCRKVLC